MSIVAAPINPNIMPLRNQILLMSQSVVNVIDDNTNRTVATASNIETIGQTATLLTPTGRLYNLNGYRGIKRNIQKAIFADRVAVSWLYPRRRSAICFVSKSIF